MSNKSSLLAELPQEVLARITIYLEAYFLLRLYLTGDSLLNQKLQQGGVTHYWTSETQPVFFPTDLSHYFLSRPTPYSQWRHNRHRYIERFSRITHLSVCYEMSATIAGPFTQQLSKLGNTLVSLKLQMQDAFRPLMNSFSSLPPATGSKHKELFGGRPFTTLILEHGWRDDVKRKLLGKPQQLSDFTNPWCNFGDMVPNLRSLTVVSPFASWQRPSKLWKGIAPYAALLITCMPSSLEELECNLVSGIIPEVLYAMAGLEPLNGGKTTLPYPGLPLLHTLRVWRNEACLFHTDSANPPLTAEAALLLPKSITSLEVPSYVTREALQILPQLLSLFVRQSTVDQIKALPLHLEHLVTQLIDPSISEPHILTLLPRELKTLKILENPTSRLVPPLSTLPRCLTILLLEGFLVTFPVSTLVHLPQGLRTLALGAFPNNELVPLSLLPRSLEFLNIPYMEKFEFCHWSFFKALTTIYSDKSTVTEEALIKAPRDSFDFRFDIVETQGFALAELGEGLENFAISRIEQISQAFTTWFAKRKVRLPHSFSYFRSTVTRELLVCSQWVTTIGPYVPCSRIPPQSLPRRLETIHGPYTLTEDAIQHLPPSLSCAVNITVELSVSRAPLVAALISSNLTHYSHPETLDDYLNRLDELDRLGEAKKIELVRPHCKTELTPQLLSALPSSLRKLTLSMDNSLSDEVARCISSSVTEIRLDGTNDSSTLWCALASGELQHLESMRTQTPRGLYSQLNRAMDRQVEEEFLDSAALPHFGFEVLPRGLKSLWVGYRFDKHLMIPQESWNLLPSGLQSLRIFFPTSFLNPSARELPRTITDLHINTKSMNWRCFGDLPPVLRSVGVANGAEIKPLRRLVLRRILPSKEMSTIPNDASNAVE